MSHDVKILPAGADGAATVAATVAGGAPAPTPADGSHGAARRERWTRLLPGLGIALGVAVLAQLISPHIPLLSPLIIAIIVGVAAANLVPLPAATAPGFALASRGLLRAGIVLLGLQLSLADVAALGAPTILMVVAIVAIGILGTLALGRILRVGRTLTLLIACGFSICGAAAVAATAGVLESDDPDGRDGRDGRAGGAGPSEALERDTVTAVALVVLFGSLMIAAIPAASSLLGLGAEDAGRWAGGSIHEIAQVVAAGGLIGGGALSTAVVVKLARILMLAPVMATLGLARRRAQRVVPAAGIPSLADGRDEHDRREASSVPQRRRPPLVPLFVIGFLAAVLLRTLLPLPEALLSLASTAQTTLLAGAMLALGCGVRLRSLLRIGPRPILLASLSTLLVAGIALVGVLLIA
ncbi:YeiH family protein [Brachybacterium sp. DNPG3]